MSGGTPFEYFPITDYSGGLNIKDSPFSIADNQLQEAYNCIITATGAIQKRPGYLQDSTHTITSGTVINNIFRYYPQTSSYTVVSAIVSGVGKIYKKAAAGAYTEITGGTALNGTKIRFKEYRDWLFMWDGSSWQASSDAATKADVVFTSGGSYVSTKTNIRFMEICDNRIFVVFNDEPNTVYFSDYGGWTTNPVTDMLFPSTNYFTIPEQTADSRGITNIKMYSENNELFIFRENDTWILLGVGTDDYTLRKFRGNAGCVSFDGIAEVSESQLVVVGNGNIYYIEGDDMVSVSDNIEPKIKYTNMSNAIATYHPNHSLVTITHPDGMLVWNINKSLERRSQAWTTFDLNVSAIHCFRASSDSNHVYFTKNNDTKLYRFGLGSSDNGSAIIFRFRTKDFDLSSSPERKQFRGLKTTQTAAVVQPFSVKFFFDGGDSYSDTYTMTLPAGGAIYGACTYGAFVYGSGKRTNGALNMTIGSIGNQISVQVYSNDTNALTIYKMALEFLGLGRDRYRTVT